MNCLNKENIILSADARVLVTGGAGFIGSNFIRHILGRADFSGKIINLDSLSYAGNLTSLADVQEAHGGSRYYFEHADIRDARRVNDLMRSHDINVVVHFAAESHVDRSITGPKEFIETNVNGTFNLLEAARDIWGTRDDVRFHHVSTDEVYGSLNTTGSFNESSPYAPSSPYSASKAASDHLVRAYTHTYGLQSTISNCSNNYGPYQFPEKLIPLVILNALSGKALPIYGDGKYVRDWLHVMDHCEALFSILSSGKSGETYNIGGNCEMQNIEVVNIICETLQKFRPPSDNPEAGSIVHYRDLISFVKDRPGHDRRYAIDSGKIKSTLGWEPSYGFDLGIEETVSWYLEHTGWIEGIVSGQYREFKRGEV
jgi:dTDP-glucose 4,6-dehydratase